MVANLLLSRPFHHLCQACLYLVVLTQLSFHCASSSKSPKSECRHVPREVPSTPYVMHVMNFTRLPSFSVRIIEKLRGYMYSGVEHSPSPSAIILLIACIKLLPVFQRWKPHPSPSTLREAWWVVCLHPYVPGMNRDAGMKCDDSHYPPSPALQWSAWTSLCNIYLCTVTLHMRVDLM